MKRLAFLLSCLTLFPATTFATLTVEYAGYLGDGGVDFSGVKSFTLAICENEVDEIPIWTEVHGDFSFDRAGLPPFWIQ